MLCDRPWRTIQAWARGWERVDSEGRRRYVCSLCHALASVRFPLAQPCCSVYVRCVPGPPAALSLFLFTYLSRRLELSATPRRIYASVRLFTDACLFVAQSRGAHPSRFWHRVFLSDIPLRSHVTTSPCIASSALRRMGVSFVICRRWNNALRHLKLTQ